MKSLVICELETESKIISYMLGPSTHKEQEFLGKTEIFRDFKMKLTFFQSLNNFFEMGGFVFFNDAPIL